MWLHFGGPNCIWYILIIENDCAHNKPNTLHYLATIFDSSAIQITLMHVNVGYKPCLIKNLMCTYMYVEF